MQVKDEEEFCICYRSGGIRIGGIRIGGIRIGGIRIGGIRFGVIKIFFYDDNLSRHDRFLIMNRGQSKCAVQKIREQFPCTFQKILVQWYNN